MRIRIYAPGTALSICDCSQLLLVFLLPPDIPQHTHIKGTFKACMVACAFKECMVACAFEACMVACAFEACMVACAFEACMVACAFKPCMVACAFKACMVACAFKPCMVACAHTERRQVLTSVLSAVSKEKKTASVSLQSMQSSGKVAHWSRNTTQVR
jgi:hypothetical protein